MTPTPRGRAIARPLLVPAAGLALILLVVACGSGFLKGLVSGGPSPDAGPDAAAARTCFDPVPDRPDASDSPTEIDLTFALEDLRVDTVERDAGLAPPEGRDLDRTCTCQGGGLPSCKAPTGQLPAQQCDGPRGRDDAFASLANQGSGLLGAADFGAYIRSGGYTTLIDVQQWNGGPDDPTVTVSIRASPGLASHADGGTDRAKLDGSDVWAVDPSSLTNGDKLVGQSCDGTAIEPCVPAYRDASAYVRDGKLIAAVDFPFVVTTPSGRLALEMKQTRLVAAISKVGGGYRLEGELIGRFPAARLLTDLAALREPSTGTALCGNATYQLLKVQICAALDIMSDPARDGADAPCDALSGAIRFVAGPAHAGLVFADDQASTDCPGFAGACAN